MSLSAPSPPAGRRWWRRDDGSDTGSFRRQIVVSTFVLGALVAIALVVVVQVVLEGSSSSAVSRVLDDRADAVIGSADSPADSPADSSRVDPARLDVPDSDLDPGVAVYDAAGRLVAGTVPPSQARAFAELSETSGTAERTEDDTYQLYARSFETSAGAAGVVVLSEPLGPYENDERNALVVSVAAGAVIVLLATALAAWASRRALAPVAAMAATAETWSEHDLQRRFHLGEPTNEIRALGQTLDVLLGRVADAIRAEQRLSSELAHELRTPLTAIKATADLVALRPDLDEELRQDIRGIQESSRVMAVTITSLLDLARTRTDHPGLGSTGARCDLHDVLEDVGRQVEHPERIRWDEHPPMTLRMPHDLATRAIVPVVQNAVQRARLVRVSATLGAGLARVEVADDGPGVPDDEAARVFAPGATTGSGAGLGLSLARRVAQSVGGDVTLVDDPTDTTDPPDPADPGHVGARFAVSLPATASTLPLRTGHR